MSEKSLAIFGWVGTTISVLMYVSYIPQIMNNLHGVKGSPVQPFVAAINGVIWVSYALLKAKKRLSFSGGECTRNYLWIDYGNYGHPVNPELFSKKWNAAISNAVFEIDLFLLDFFILMC